MAKHKNRCLFVVFVLLQCKGMEFSLISIFSLTSYALASLNEAEVTGFLKYCFGSKLIDRFVQQETLFNVFISFGCEKYFKVFCWLERLSLKVSAI